MIPDLTKLDGDSELIKSVLRLEVVLSVARADNFHIGRRRNNSRKYHLGTTNLKEADEERLDYYYWLLVRKCIGGSVNGFNT